MKLLPLILITLGLAIGLLGVVIGGGYGYGNEGATGSLRHTAKGLAALGDEQLAVVWPGWNDRPDQWAGLPGGRDQLIRQRLGVPWLYAIDRGAWLFFMSSIGLGLLLIVLGIGEAMGRHSARSRATVA